MKISIGTKIKNSAWGGGNNFAKNLTNYLSKNGVEVYFDLKEKNLDAIILTDPRRNSISSSFDDLDIIKYQQDNHKTIVIHRINECDERKNTNNINEQLLRANKVSDYTVFVSSWLKKLLVNYGFDVPNSSVILNGADNKIFNYSDNTWLDGKIKIVTHHWSNHPNKGVKTYKMMDDLINKPEWKDKVEFYYVGNLPDNVKFNNLKLISPLSGKELSDFLSSCHIYLTGSINEPGGNHQNEGANIGLPILYLNSGSMNEYCKNYGVAFEYNNFEEKLKKIMKDYRILRNNLKNYPYNSEYTCKRYYDLILNILKNKDLIISKKKLPKFTLRENITILLRKFKIK